MYTSLSTTKEMTTHLKDRVKFPLGRNVYATVGAQNGKIQINILKYKVLKSIFHPTVLAPTQFGVTMNEKQFQQLLNIAPLVVAEMSSLEGCSTASSSEIVQRSSPSSNINQPPTTSISQVYAEKTTTPAASKEIVQSPSATSTTGELPIASTAQTIDEKTTTPNSSSEIVQIPLLSVKTKKPTTTSTPPRRLMCNICSYAFHNKSNLNKHMKCIHTNDYQRSSPPSTTKEPPTTSIPRVYVEKTPQPVKILPKPTDLGDKAVTRPLTNVPRPASLRLKKKAASKDPWRTILLDHPLPLKKRRVRSPSKHRKQQTNTKSVDKKRLMNNTKTEPKCLINDTKPAICCPGEVYDVPTQEIQELGADIAPNHEVDDHEYPTETL